MVAVPNLFATVAAIFRRQHALLLRAVVITGRPSVIGTFFQDDHLLGGKLEALLSRIELRPALTQLVAPMLGDEEASHRVKVESFTVADAGGIPFLWREDLVRSLLVLQPARFRRNDSSSVQELFPGECGTRFCTSHALVADPIETSRLPCASIAKGRMA